MADLQLGDTYELTQHIEIWNDGDPARRDASIERGMGALDPRLDEKNFQLYEHLQAYHDILEDDTEKQRFSTYAWGRKVAIPAQTLTDVPRDEGL